MLLEITLAAPPGADYDARDLGCLLHKNPANVHTREAAGGTAYMFFSEASAERCTAALRLEVDPVALVRGAERGAEGLLDHYVNDRPYTANSFLAVALARSLGQTIAGRSKERTQVFTRRPRVQARPGGAASLRREEAARRRPPMRARGPGARERTRRPTIVRRLPAREQAADFRANPLPARPSLL